MPLTALRSHAEEMIHGVPVRDPYRWLEDRSSPETEGWIANQKLLCADYFGRRGDLNVIRDRVRKYLDVAITDQPAKVGNRYFYRHRDRGEEQASLYARDIETGRERLLVDPAPLGPFAAVGIHSISKDASLLCYDLRCRGGGRKSIHFVNVESGQILGDGVAAGYARGLVFASNHRGFFYCQEYPESSDDHAIRFHSFGSSSADERTCLRLPRGVGSRLVLISDNTCLGAIYIHRSADEVVLDLWIADEQEPTEWRRLLRNRRHPCTLILKHGRIFALSYERAANGEFLEFDITSAEERSLVPEREGTINQFAVVDDRLFINRLIRMQPSIECWSLTGEPLGHLDVPENNTVQILPTYGDNSDVLFYACESFSEPRRLFEYTRATNESRLWHQSEVPADCVRTSVRKAIYASKDGTPIPISLVAGKKDRDKEPCATLLTGYGGFGFAVTPRFSILVTILMELGATFVVPNLRGGGEFGRDWHEAARGKNRQNAFDDFIAAAEWLLKNGITAPDRLAIFGGSNSGLLVAAAMTQRPDLFRAVLCIAPLLDMVRYESFDQAIKWRLEYGSVEDEQEFRALYAYSPYHRVQEGIDYPSVLFVSGDSDDRCNPAHVRKMAAHLQNRSAQRSPILVDYCEERGHSPVLPLTVRINALARRIMFLCLELGIPIDFGGDRETTGD